MSLLSGRVGLVLLVLSAVAVRAALIAFGAGAVAAKSNEVVTPVTSFTRGTLPGYKKYWGTFCSFLMAYG